MHILCKCCRRKRDGVAPLEHLALVDGERLHQHVDHVEADHPRVEERRRRLQPLPQLPAQDEEDGADDQQHHRQQIDRQQAGARRDKRRLTARVSASLVGDGPAHNSK